MSCCLQLLKRFRLEKIVLGSIKKKMCFLPVNKDNQLTLKWGEGGVNRPTWESICPIHIAVQNGDMVCRYKKKMYLSDRIRNLHEKEKKVVLCKNNAQVKIMVIKFQRCKIMLSVDVL